MKSRYAINLAIMFSVLTCFINFSVFADHPGGVDLDKSTTPNFDYDVLSTDDNTSTSFFPAGKTQNVIDAISTDDPNNPAFPGYHQSYITMGFNAPFFSIDPKSVHIWDCGCAFANAPEGLVNIDAPSTNGKNELCLRKLTGHEIFHHVQYSYINFDEWPAWGGWVVEGTVKSMEDKVYSDVDLGDNLIPNCSSYYARITEYINQTEDTLWDFTYPVALFWTYLAEQIGSTPGPTQQGVDFIRRFWERTEDKDPDGIGVLRNTISEFSPGTSLEDMFHDFIIANYAKDLNLLPIPNAQKFQYIDDDAPANAYPTVTVANVAIDSDQSDSVDRWGVKYFESTVSNGCDIAGFRSDGDFAAYGLMVTRADGTVSHIFQSRGDSFAKAVINNNANPITKLTAVVGAFDDDADFDYVFGCGNAKMEIKNPDEEKMAFVGEPDEPERFLVKLVVTGPESLGEPTVRGLNPNDFEVFVGEIDPENKGTVIAGANVQGEYWLVVQAPKKTEELLGGDMDGEFEINVTLGDISAFERSAVVYITVRRDQIVLIDKSGSMDSPAGFTKLEAAKNAAKLFIDAASDEDKLGVVSFSGDNDNELNDDATIVHNLKDVAGQRNNAKTGVTGINPENMTSIGDGLSMGQTELQLNGDPENHEQFLVLLSDGEQNEPFFWGEDPDIKETILNAGTTVHTIALGPETDQEIMQDIAAQTGGEYYYVDVGELDAGDARISTISPFKALAISVEELPNRLSNTFKLINEKILRHERLWFAEGNIFDNGTSIHNIAVDEESIREADFAFNWTGDNDQDVAIRVTSPDGSELKNGDPGVTFFEDKNHLVIQLKELKNGNWTVEITALKGSTSFTASLSARIINGVKFDLFFGQLNTDSNIKANNGLFVRGIPMPIFGLLTDRKGAVIGADVEIIIEAPDGKMDKLILFDDGNHNDGSPRDGVYGNIYTRTTLGSQGGVVEGNESTGTRGSYTVNAVATGVSNLDTKFTRFVTKSFHLFEFDEKRSKESDPDGDGMPTRWEELFDLEVFKNDAKNDLDSDSLINIDEFNYGTKPNDPDTDDGGESDFSEVKRGSDPLNPNDDRIPRPIDVGIIHVDSHPIPVQPMPNSNLIHFPINKAYETLLLLRSKDPDDGFETVAKINPKEFRGIFFDEDLVNNVTYFYKMVAVGFNGEQSAPSHTFSGTPKEDPIPPFSSGFTINNDALVTDFFDVILNIDTSSDAIEMRISNNASFSDVKWEQVKPTKEWRIEADTRTNLAFVFLQLRDKFLNESEIYSSGITLDLAKPGTTPSPTQVPSPTPTPKPDNKPTIMVPDKSEIVINVNGGEGNVKVQLFDKDRDTVPNWPVFATSSIARIADVKPVSVNSDKNGIAEFTIIGDLAGDTSITFTTEPGLKVSVKVKVTRDAIPTPEPTVQPSLKPKPTTRPSPTPTAEPSQTPIPTVQPSPTPEPRETPSTIPDKSFTFECGSKFNTGIRGISRLIMKLGEEESCLLKLTNISPGVPVDVSAIQRTVSEHSVEINPLNGKTNEDGELNINIKAVKRGRTWAAWGIPENDRRPTFNKEAYDKGLSWGMVIEVQ